MRDGSEVKTFAVKARALMELSRYEREQKGGRKVSKLKRECDHL